MSYLVIRINMKNAAVSQYTEYDFDSFCKFNSKCLACGSSGIYELGGSDDDGSDISAAFRNVTTDFGVPFQKRLRSLFIGGEWNGWLKVTVTDDEANAREYLTSPLDSGNLQEGNKVAIGRDGKGRYWTFEIENVKGCDFSIDSLDALVIFLNRRMSGWRHTEDVHGVFEEEDLPIFEADGKATV